MVCIDPFALLKGMSFILLVFTFKKSHLNLIFILSLIEKPVTLMKILAYLDHQSLRNVQQVCKAWNEAVNGGCAWKEQLQYEVTISVFHMFQNP